MRHNCGILDSEADLRVEPVELLTAETGFNQTILVEIKSQISVMIRYPRHATVTVGMAATRSVTMISRR
jgi:hypothetical protein